MLELPHILHLIASTIGTRLTETGPLREVLPPILGGAVPVVLTAYALSRTRYARLSGWLYVFVNLAVPALVLLLAGSRGGTSPLISVPFIVPAVLLAGVLGSVGAPLMTGLVGLSAMVLITNLVGPPSWIPELRQSGLFVSLAGFLIVIFGVHRDKVEADRAGELRARNEELEALRRSLEERVRERTAELQTMHLAERKRLAAELEIAARMQAALLPSMTPIQNLEIGCQMWPATEVGGDYFDVLPCEDGAWLAVGDVSGHGINAGMIMLMVQSAIACLVSERPDANPGAVLTTVNGVLHQNIRRRLKEADFVTLTLLRYFQDGRLQFAGAHEDILILRAATGKVDRVFTPGTWLGLMSDCGPHMTETSVRLEPGDIIVLYTDGITEARTAEGKQFGIERLAAAVAGAGQHAIGEIRDAVRSSVRAWTGREQEEDDMSLVIARYQDPGSA